MRKDLTEIVLVVDRSGSMASIRTDAEGGINTFIEQQQKEPGHANFTLVQFDTMYEFVHSGVPIRQVPHFTLEPRGSTALLDAVGRTINETGSRLAKMNEADRPGLVVFLIVTDGEENSSREFTREQIRKMIEHQQSVYNWQFTFLAANQDAFAEAGAMGIHQDGAANYSMKKVAAAHAAAGSKVSRQRAALQMDEAIDNRFTAEERKSME
jgi:uncharacterized protein YegL